MTDQFQFENPGDESEEFDQLEPERSLLDRGIEDPPDEGYAPPDFWSPTEYGAKATDQADGEELEQRLEQEDPDVEDDWDEDVVEDGGSADEATDRRAG